MSSGKYVSKLKGSRILVFGATSGMGYVVSEAALEHGAKVIITGSKQTKLTDTTSRLLGNYDASEDKPSSRVFSHVCDLSEQEAMEKNLITLLEAATNSKANNVYPGCGKSALHRTVDAREAHTHLHGPVG
ncbi:hypothetical protein CJF30_00009676 [Rutstroemia sp. NJR-2017a BBW]|nr:hypothetical protein CJF30_00009676 [Rutstroemia sp. NJR-2017a BBW]